MTVRQVSQLVEKHNLHLASHTFKLQLLYFTTAGARIPKSIPTTFRNAKQEDEKRPPHDYYHRLFRNPEQTVTPGPKQRVAALRRENTDI